MPRGAPSGGRGAASPAPHRGPRWWSEARAQRIDSSTSATLHWILRAAVAACFIGHGTFGVITKAAWLPYFAIFGIPEAWAWKLMPVVGTVDISVGVLTLIQPVRAVVLYMTFWGLLTASLRPIAGQGMWEFLERAGNYGVPLAFLWLLGVGRSLVDWFSARPAPPLTDVRVSEIGWILRVTTALLLIGHGGFDFAMSKKWTDYGSAVGISPATLAAHPFTPLAGWFELALGLLVLAWPKRGVLLFVFAWKLGTEAFRPLAGEPIWEFIERRQLRRSPRTRVGSGLAPDDSRRGPSCDESAVPLLVSHRNNLSPGSGPMTHRSPPARCDDDGLEAPGGTSSIIGRGEVRRVVECHELARRRPSSVRGPFVHRPSRTRTLGRGWTQRPSRSGRPDDGPGSEHGRGA